VNIIMHVVNYYTAMKSNYVFTTESIYLCQSSI